MPAPSIRSCIVYTSRLTDSSKRKGGRVKSMDDVIEAVAAAAAACVVAPSQSLSSSAAVAAKR